MSQIPLLEQDNILDAIAAKSSYMAVLKVQANCITLRGLNATEGVHISCQELGNRGESNIKVFVLGESKLNMDKCVFQYQSDSGVEMKTDDLAIFIDQARCMSEKCSYSIDLGFMANEQTGVIDRNGDEMKTEDLTYVKVGRAYFDLDPMFATQGTQRLQVIGLRNPASIGSIEVDYLVVKNPLAYNNPAPRPIWLSHASERQMHIGHRGSGSGCRSDLPKYLVENTLASFNYAARHGADMCELDVMCTKEGIPVIFHDFKLKETDSTPERQIDQLTLVELRSFSTYGGVHDQDCKHLKTKVNASSELVGGDSPSTKTIATALEQVQSETQTPTSPDYTMFPTLEEVLQGVDINCALNIELKWPQLLGDGRSEATRHREINDHADLILNCIRNNHLGRPILLSTFDADLAILLRLKQDTYPVLFLTTGDSQYYHDPTTKTVENAIHFAQAFDMAGINPDVEKLSDFQVQYAKDRGLMVYAWGKIESADAIRALKKTGLDGIIYDRVDLIKPRVLMIM